MPPTRHRNAPAERRLQKKFQMPSAKSSRSVADTLIAVDIVWGIPSMKPRPSVRSECGEEDERSSGWRLVGVISESEWSSWNLKVGPEMTLFAKSLLGHPASPPEWPSGEATQSAWPVQTSQPQFSDTVLTPSRTCTVRQTARTRSTCASRIDTSCRPAVVSEAFEGGRGTKRNRLTRGHSLWPSR